MQHLLPHDPLLICGDLPPVEGRLGPDPSDFQVDELPLYPFSGEGEHLLVRVRKRLCTTPELVARLAQAAGVAAKDVGIAGMKDKHAVTSQWISLPSKARPPETWELPDGVELLEVTRHGNKLRTGHLSGNRFRLRLLGVALDAGARAARICQRIEERGLPNYFGAQRFGYHGSNLTRALEWLEASQRRRRGRDRFQHKLYPSVLQAEVFNRYLSSRLERGLDRLLHGEVVRLAGSGSLFVVEDPERERSRLLARDIWLTGPMWGPRTRAAAGAALELEQQAAADAGLSEAALGALSALVPGTRRDLVVVPEQLVLESPAPGELVLGFVLPSGSYATQLLRELTHAAFLGPSAAPSTA